MFLILLLIAVYVLFVAQKIKITNKKEDKISIRICQAVSEISKQTGLNKILPIEHFMRRLESAMRRASSKVSRQDKDSMSLSEAHEVLGLQNSASKDDVKKAFRKLMLVNHPDSGGTKYLANKIILAKEKLLQYKK